MSQLGNQICCTISTRKSSSCLRWCQRSSKNCSQLGTGMLLRRFYMHIVLFPSYCPYRICNVCIGLLQILPNFKLSHYHHGCVFCSSPFRCSERHEQTRVAQQYIYIYIQRIKFLLSQCIFICQESQRWFLNERRDTFVKQMHSLQWVKFDQLLVLCPLPSNSTLLWDARKASRY